MRYCFFLNDTATTEIYTLPLHDALPIYDHGAQGEHANQDENRNENRRDLPHHPRAPFGNERDQRTDEDDKPEDDPATAQHLRYQPAERDQEEGDQHQFQDDEVAVSLHQLAIGHCNVAPPAGTQQDTGGGAAPTPGEEQPAKRPGIAPDWLVALGQDG